MQFSFRSIRFFLINVLVFVGIVDPSIPFFFNNFFIIFLPRWYAYPPHTSLFYNLYSDLSSPEFLRGKKTTIIYNIRSEKLPWYVTYRSLSNSWNVVHICIKQLKIRKSRYLDMQVSFSQEKILYKINKKVFKENIHETWSKQTKQTGNKIFIKQKLFKRMSAYRPSTVKVHDKIHFDYTDLFMLLHDYKVHTLM